MAQYVTKRELAIQEGKSTRWVEMHADQFQVKVSDSKARNGRAQKLFCIADATPAAAEVQVPALAATSQVVAPTADSLGSNFSDEDRAVTLKRFCTIEPLISPEKFPEEWVLCGHKKTALIKYLAEKHGVKRSTIYGWWKAFNGGGLPALVPNDRSDKGRPRVFNDAALELILRIATESNGYFSGKEGYRIYEEDRVFREANLGRVLDGETGRKYARYLDSDDRLTADALLPKASIPTFYRWRNKIPSALRVMTKGGVEAFANSQELISYRDIESLRPLQFLVLDHRRLDLFAMVRRRDNWALVRPWLTACIDYRTRKWLSWVIVESPSSDSIGSVLKRAFLDYGIPEAIYVDNGRDFTAEYLEGRERRRGEPYRVSDLEEGMRGVLQTLHVRICHAIVRRARSKIIEPAFINTANYDKTLPWHCGHRPSDRPERFNELVKEHQRWLKGEIKETPFRPIEHIAWLYDSFLKSLNEREHSGDGMSKITCTGKGWYCPNEIFEILIPKVPRRWAPPEVIQCCFHRRREVTVAHSEVKFTLHGRTCHYRPTEDPTRLIRFNGRKIQVAYDPFDLETVALYHDGQFICLAVDAELRKMGAQDFVTDEKDRRRMRREVKAMIQEIHRAVPIASAEERALRRDGVMPVRFEPERALEPIPIPPGIVAEATARSRAPEPLDFENVSIEAVQIQETDGGDEFHFFKEASE